MESEEPRAQMRPLLAFRYCSFQFEPGVVEARDRASSLGVTRTRKAIAKLLMTATTNRSHALVNSVRA